MHDVHRFVISGGCFLQWSSSRMAQAPSFGARACTAAIPAIVVRSAVAIELSSPKSCGLQQLRGVLGIGSPEAFVTLARSPQ